MPQPLFQTSNLRSRMDEIGFTVKSEVDFRVLWIWLVGVPKTVSSHLELSALVLPSMWMKSMDCTEGEAKDLRSA